MGCEGRGLFSLFGGQPPQCGPITNQIQQMRANLDKVLADLQQLQGNSADREGQRRAILTQLAQNDCGPQYRAYASRGATGFFESLFGGGVGSPGAPGAPPEAGVSDGSTYRTVCVRTCDGYYFPVSYSTTPANFQADEQTCQRMCPASETALYSHRNPGEDVAQALSSERPALFRAAHRFCLSQGVQRRLQLQGRRPDLGGRAPRCRRPDRRARRHRGDRRAGQAALAAGRCQRPADGAQGRTEGQGRRNAGSGGTGPCAEWRARQALGAHRRADIPAVELTAPTRLGRAMFHVKHFLP